MVKDAQMFAEEDRQRKELAEVRNEADTLVYSTEKMLRELGDKLEDTTKAAVETAINKVKEETKTDNVTAIRRALEDLTREAHALSTKMYEQEKAAKADTDAPADNAVDAEYHVVDDEEK
jgi:molecular chaperone DnaK